MVDYQQRLLEPAVGVGPRQSQLPGGGGSQQKALGRALENELRNRKIFEREKATKNVLNKLQAEAMRMIREIRGFAMLEGVRGAPPSDIAALARFLSDLSRFAAAHADRIESIDLNPVRVLPRGEGLVPE